MIKQKYQRTSFRHDFKQNPKEYYRKYMKKYRQQNKESYNEYQRKYRSRKQQQLKEKYIKMLDGKCQRCGYNEYVGALEFHHLNNSKERKQESRRKAFDQKIKKGDIQLLCSNCHKNIHHEIHALNQKGRERAEIPLRSMRVKI